jgi:hypothetical protein
MNTALVFVIGVLLRIGIPLALTSVIFYLLRRLDERWQKEAQVIPVAVAGKPCWEIKGCSAQKKKACPAFAQPKVPCWQVFRAKDGVMKEACLGCAVFRLASAPVLS